MTDVLAARCMNRWRTCNEPAGRCERTLALGPLRLALEGLDENDVELLSRRWGAFVAPADDGLDATVRIHVREGGTDPWLGEWEPGELYRLETHATAAGKPITLSYRFALARDNGASWILALARGAVEPRERTIENAIRFLAARLATEAGGFALHGAGVLHEGHAVLFSGPSGAGKSTAMRHSAPRPSLGDDYALVLPGTDSGWVAPALPFDNAGQAPNAPAGGPFPVAGIYRLIQAQQDRVRPLGALAATRALMQSNVLPWAMPDLQPLVLKQLNAFIGKVRVADLELRDAPDFWGPLADDLSSAGC